MKYTSPKRVTNAKCSHFGCGKCGSLARPALTCVAECVMKLMQMNFGPKTENRRICLIYEYVCACYV